MKKLVVTPCLIALLLLAGCSSDVDYKVNGVEIVGKVSTLFPSYGYKGKVDILIDGSIYTFQAGAKSFDLVQKGSKVDITVLKSGEVKIRPAFIKEVVR